MDDFVEIVKLYPEMILVSKSPPSWKGLLNVDNKGTKCKMKVKVKLVVPLYPRLDNAVVQFGGSIAFLFGTNFKKQVEALIKKSESVPDFFQQLTATIEKLLCDDENNQIQHNLIDPNIRERLLKELRNILSENSDVEILSTKDLSAIKLVMSDISLTVQPILTSTGQSSWKIISSDLPELLSYTSNEKKSVSLKEIRNMFLKQVNTLEDVWYELRKIDNYCWVIDPIHSKPYHLYRRIYLSPLLSFLLILNPMDPTGFPQIKFLGAKNEVEKYRDAIRNEDAIEKWDLEYSVYENLLTLLNIDEFPQAPSIDEPTEDNGIVGDEECCICFSMELNGCDLPNEICNNQKCRRYFHSECLFQWLQELATNRIVFNKIFGPCPNCGEEVSCNVSSN